MISRQKTHWLALFALVLAASLASPLPAQERYLELYEVGDLIRPIRHFPAPKLGLDQGEVVFDETNEAISEEPMWTGERLVELLEQLLGTGDDQVHVQIISGSSLAVIATPKAQRDVGQFLRGLRDDKSGIYSIHAQIVSIPRKHLARFHVSEERATTTPSSKEVHETIRELTNTSQLQLISSPTIAVVPKDRASIAITEQMAYVSDLEVREGVVDPTISTITIGTTLELTVKQTPSAKQPVGNLLEWKATRATAPLPFTTVQVGVFGEIQLPEVALRSTAGRALLKGDQCLVVANLGSATDTARCELLIVHVEGPHR